MDSSEKPAKSGAGNPQACTYLDASRGMHGQDQGSRNVRRRVLPAKSVRCAHATRATAERRVAADRRGERAR